MNRQRKSSESVAQFALALRDCEYPRDYQDQALRDMFVKGLSVTAVQTKLMLRDNSLKFEEAYKTVIAEELAVKSSTEFNETSGAAPTTTTVHHMSSQRANWRKAYPQKNTAATSIECFRCGGYHLAKKCKFLDQKCHFYKKTGYIVKMCKSKGHRHRQVTSTKVAHVDMQLDGHMVSMQVDIDTSIPFRSRETCLQNCRTRRSLQRRFRYST